MKLNGFMFKTKTLSYRHEELNEGEFYSRFNINSVWCGLNSSFAFICPMEFLDNGAISNSILASKRTFYISLKHIYHTIHPTFRELLVSSSGEQGKGSGFRNVVCIWVEAFLRLWKKSFYLVVLPSRWFVIYVDVLLLRQIHNRSQIDAVASYN